MKNISTATINALLDDKKKDFKRLMNAGYYEDARDVRNQAIGIIQVLSMSLNYNDPIKYHDFYEEKMDGFEKSTEMMKWELDHLR